MATVRKGAIILGCRSSRIAAGALGLAIALLAGALVLGLRADVEPRSPTTAAEGIVSQVCQPPGESVHARCAVILARPLDEIWAALTDYESYGDVCSSIHHADVSYNPSSRTRIHAKGESLLGGQLPFTVELDHERQLDRYTVTWTDTGGTVRNRGQWRLTPRGTSETLVELKQEVEVQWVPTFIVRTLLLPRLRKTVADLEQRLASGPSGKPW